MKVDATNVAAGGMTLLAARIKLGYEAITPNADRIRQMLDEGPYMIIRSGAKADHVPVGASRISTFDIPVDLWIGLERQTDDDMTNLEKLLEAIDEAWIDHVTTWDAPVISTKQNSALVHVALSVEVKSGC